MDTLTPRDIVAAKLNQIATLKTALNFAKKTAIKTA
jgi:hypothetical protein